jgi:hypothetical protein
LLTASGILRSISKVIFAACRNVLQLEREKNIFLNIRRTPLLPAIISHFAFHGFEIGAVCVAHLKINKYGD